MPIAERIFEGSIMTKFSSIFRLARSCLGRPIGLFVLVILFSTCAQTGFAASIPLDEPGFTKALAKAFRKAMPGTKVKVQGPLELAIRPPDGTIQRAP